MAGPYTTDANLLDGVGEFEPIDKGELLSLLTQEERALGIGTGALTNYHNVAWQRVVNDCALDGLDVTGSLTDEAETLIKAICCHYIMHMLYRKGRQHKDDKANLEQRYHKGHYDRMRGRIAVLMPSGRTSRAGQAIRVMRG